MTGKMAWQDIGFGLGVVALAAVLAWQATLIPEVAFSQVGPNVFPKVSAGMLGLLGVMLVIVGWRGGWDHQDSGAGTDWRSLMWMIGGLGLNAGLIETAGFIIASSLMFTCIAQAFGSRQPIRDALVGLTLAATAYVGFDRILGYKIGSGLIERLI